MKQGTHAAKMKRQVFKAGLLAKLEEINTAIDSAAPILEGSENLNVSIAFAKLYDAVARISDNPPQS